MSKSSRRLWWQTGIINQIYPRSFQDSNGDGLGDLATFNRLVAEVHQRNIAVIIDFQKTSP